MSVVSFALAVVFITRGKTFGKRDTQPCLNLSLFEKWQTISTSQSVSETFVLVFYAQYLIFWEQCSKEILSCHPWESIEIDVLFYGHQ